MDYHHHARLTMQGREQLAKRAQPTDGGQVGATVSRRRGGGPAGPQLAPTPVAAADLAGAGGAGGGAAARALDG